VAVFKQGDRRKEVEGEMAKDIGCNKEIAAQSIATERD